jgi:hypothetical protein
VQFSLLGVAGFVVSRPGEFRPNQLIEWDILRRWRSAFRGVIAIFVVFPFRDQASSWRRRCRMI